MKKRFVIIVAALLTATLTFAQSADPFSGKDNAVGKGDKRDKNILNHLDGSITLGTTGLGVDLAMILTRQFRTRSSIIFLRH